MRIRPTRILAWAVVAAVAFGFYVAFQPKPAEVDLARVVRGPLQVTLDDEGQTRVRDRYVVSAPLAGRVLRIEHEPGDVVRAGSTVIARFRPTRPGFLDQRTRADAQARVETNVASVNRARVELDLAKTEEEFARSDLRRRQQLHDNGLLADDALASANLRAETASEAVRAAESAILVAEAELERARTALIEAGATAADDNDVITLTSPINGVVLRRLRESEAVVPSGEPLVEIADPQKLEIVSDMLSIDAVRIVPGNRVLIEQWGGDRALEGKVRLVEPYGFTKISALGVEEQRVNVIVDFADPRAAWEALGDGYRVEIRVVVWEELSVLKVPSSSLFRNGEDWAVYRIDELSVARLHTVEIGQRTPREVQIVSGLGVGEPVIAYPSDQIEDGTEVVEREL